MHKAEAETITVNTEEVDLLVDYFEWRAGRHGKVTRDVWEVGSGRGWRGGLGLLP